MVQWQDYADYRQTDEHTVVGQMRVLPGVYSPQLDNSRDIFVYLPPSYHEQAERRYPVIYMHDGQNLFDQGLSFNQEWHVDESLHQLSGMGIEAIVVGIPNTHERLNEYSPFEDEKHGGGRGDAYLAFLAETIKPRIDADFRTLSERDHTGMIGSSMGGLISLYGFFKRADVFGFVGSLSPALWFAGEAITPFVQAVEMPPSGRLYLDAGTQELRGQPDAGEKSLAYINSVRRMRDLLVSKGCQPGHSLLYMEEPGADHSESAWARRLPIALQFLLTPYTG